jgi:hypothetical protein
MHRFRVLIIAAIAALTLVAATPSPAAIPSNDEIFSTIEDLVGFSPRRVGTPGIDRTVDYIARRYHELGMTRVRIEETPTYSWESLGHSLLFGGQPVDASPVIYSQSPAADHVGETSTPLGGLTAPVVDVGLATAAEVGARDVEGKIVMFDLKFLLPIAGLVPDMEFLWDPEQTMALSPPTLLTANPYITTFTDAVKAAQDGGAVGFVGVLGDYFDSNKYYNEFYRRQIVNIPGMWVTKAEGARLREQLAAQPDTTASIALRARREKVPSHVVVGFLEGKSTDAIQIHSHHDSGHDGAVEDASGVAEVLALAEHYAGEPLETREKTLMFTTFDSHFSGYHAHNAFLKRHIFTRDPKRDPNRIVADVTLEHIAKHALRGPDGELEVSELPEPRGIFENMAPAMKSEIISAVVDNDLRRTAMLNGSTLQPVGIPTDSSGWVILGIPTASFISGPLYLYDAVDTLDKVLKSELNKVAATFVQITDAIDETPSDQLGAVPIAPDMGKLIVGDTSKIPDSVDRPWTPPLPGCIPAAGGRAIRDARLSGRRLRFVARRTVTLRATAVLRGKQRKRLRARRLTACRRYRVSVPKGTRRVHLRWRDGRVVVRRR